MTTFDFNTFLQCLEGTLQNLNALIECAKDMANGGDINTFNVSNVKSKEMKEETKESTPCTPLKKEKKKAKKAPPTPSKEGSANTKRAEGISKKMNNSQTIEERRAAFKAEVARFVEKEGKDLCNAFYAYWTEPTRDGQKMRFETQRTWDTERRIIYWKRHAERLDTKPRKRSKDVEKRDREAFERREREQMENEERRKYDRLSAVPPWALKALKTRGLLKDDITPEEAWATLERLSAIHALTDEEEQHANDWYKAREKDLRTD